MSLGKTRFWVLITIALVILTTQSALFEPLLATAKANCGETEACATLALFRAEYIEPLLFGLMLLALTSTAARRLPALGASGWWSLLILVLAVQSYAAIRALGDDAAAAGQIPFAVAALGAFLGFLMICPETLYRGYKTSGAKVAWIGVWLAIGLTIWGHLPALTGPLTMLPQTAGLAAGLQTPLAQAQEPLGLAQALVPLPLDLIVLAMLGATLLALVVRPRGRTGRIY